MIFRDIGMATASLVGSLETKLAAVRSAGFSQVMIAAAGGAAPPGAALAAGSGAAFPLGGLRVRVGSNDH